MIRVSHKYHYVRPDSKLHHRWSIMIFKAAVAYVLGQTADYEKLYKEALNEYEQWENYAKIESDKKSHKNWLGGGETYIVLPLNLKHEFDMQVMILSDRTPQEIIETYYECAKNNWMRLYSPF